MKLSIPVDFVSTSVVYNVDVVEKYIESLKSMYESHINAQNIEKWLNTVLKNYLLLKGITKNRKNITDDLEFHPVKFHSFRELPDLKRFTPDIRAKFEKAFSFRDENGHPDLQEVEITREFEQSMEHGFAYLKTLNGPIKDVSVFDAVKRGEHLIKVENERIEQERQARLDFLQKTGQHPEDEQLKDLEIVFEHGEGEHHYYIADLVTHTTPNGSILTSDRQLERESGLMKHCVGHESQGYKDLVKKGIIHIYSLRDKDNTPHATLELVIHEKRIKQIKGMKNGPIVKRYHDCLKAFLHFLTKNGKITQVRDLQNAGILVDSNGNWECLYKLPKNFKYNRDLRITGITDLTFLPENLQIKGDFELDRCNGLVDLSKVLNLTAYRVIIQNCQNLESLPENNMLAENNISLSNNKQLVEMPKNVKANDLLINECPKLAALHKLNIKSLTIKDSPNVDIRGHTFKRINVDSKFITQGWPKGLVVNDLVSYVPLPLDFLRSATVNKNVIVNGFRRTYKEYFTDIPGEEEQLKILKDLVGNTVKVVKVGSVWHLDGNLDIDIDNYLNDPGYEYSYAYIIDGTCLFAGKLLDIQVNIAVETHIMEYEYDEDMEENEAGDWEKQDSEDIGDLEFKFFVENGQVSLREAPDEKIHSKQSYTFKEILRKTKIKLLEFVGREPDYDDYDDFQEND